MKPKDIVFILFILILMSFLTGCIETNNNSNDNNSSKDWGDAPDFSLKTLKGNTITLSNYLGDVILVDLMAVDCQFCVYMMPDLKQISQNYTDVVIISVDVYSYETEEYLQSFIDAFKEQLGIVLDWNFGKDSDGSISQKYLGPMEGIPKLVLIDQNGNIYYEFMGYTQYSEIKNKLDEIV